MDLAVGRPKGGGEAQASNYAEPASRRRKEPGMMVSLCIRSDPKASDPSYTPTHLTVYWGGGPGGVGGTGGVRARAALDDEDPEGDAEGDGEEAVHEGHQL